MDEIKKALGTDKIIMGTEKTMKALRKGELKKIFLAANAEKKTTEDITRYAELTKTEIERLKITNDELGTTCRKPYSIMTIGLKK